MSLIRTISNKLSNFSPVRIIVSSFLIIIIGGTFLLTLPLSSRDGKFTNVLDCLFVATSCTCVTGLNLFDTWTKWTEFGQFVMLALIQLGGLGLVTFTTGFTLVLRRRLGLRDMQIVREYTNGSVMEIAKLLRTILGVTFSCEAIGAILLSLKLVPQFGVYGWWLSIFTAVSAYCNAGFDIMGIQTPGVSLSDFATDPLISLTVSALIVLGGLGFIVIIDLHSYISKKSKNLKSHPRINTHSYVVLVTTAVLLIFGTVAFFILEYNNSLRGMNFIDKTIVSLFQSASARTAGFFTADIGKETDVTKLVTCLLMFIGASPSSTGGGIKTTTFVTIMATVLSILKGRPDTVIRRRTVNKITVYKAMSITVLSLLIVMITTGVIAVSDSAKDLAGIDIIFEAVSAFSTTGLSTGITTLLGAASKISLILTMFIGRVGPVSLVFALTLKHAIRTETVLPEARLIVG